MSGNGQDVFAPGQGSADPSMEDILASIRRILSEDEPESAHKPALVAAEPSGDVLMLDESMLVQEPLRPVAPNEPPLHVNMPLAALGSFTPAPPQSDVTSVAAPPAATSVPDAIEPPSPASLAEHNPPASALSAKAATMDVAPTVPAESAATMSSLVAPEVTAAAAAAMGSLLRTLSAERQATVYRGGPSIEDVVREEMRPMLKEWLDNNLPSMVERLVRLEIERMVGHAKL